MPEITRNDSVSVDTSVVQLSPPVVGGRRVEISVRNNSTGGQVVSIVPSNNQQAVAGTGIVLAAGQSFTQSEDNGYKPFQGNFTIIADVAGAVVSIYERQYIGV